jgi:hypothetical protein
MQVKAKQMSRMPKEQADKMVFSNRNSSPIIIPSSNFLRRFLSPNKLKLTKIK